MSEEQKVLYKPFNELERTIAEFFNVIKREREARIKAEEINRRKDAFMAVVFHETRNLLNPIIGWTHLLRSGKVDEFHIARATEVIERSAKIQRRMIEDLIDVSQISSGFLQMKFEEMEINSVIDNALLDIRPAAEAKQIRLIRNISPNLGRIYADPFRLEQVLLNLFSNSIKFTPPGGKVEIETSRTDTGIKLKIMDNGRGISTNYLPFVFEQFSQEHREGTEKLDGLGLGLSIVRQIIEQHGGTVIAESAGRGTGSTFVIKLPNVCNLEED